MNTAHATPFVSHAGHAFPFSGFGVDGVTLPDMPPKQRTPSGHVPKDTWAVKNGYRLVDKDALRERLQKLFDQSGDPSMRFFSTRCGLNAQEFHSILENLKKDGARGPSREKLESIADGNKTTLAALLAEQVFPYPPSRRAPTTTGVQPRVDDKGIVQTTATKPDAAPPAPPAAPAQPAPLAAPAKVMGPVVGAIPDIRNLIAEARKLAVQVGSRISEETWESLPQVAASMQVASPNPLDALRVLKLAAFLESEKNNN